MIQYGMLVVVAAVLERGREVLVCQRRADGPHPLKWEFPGGKAEPGEEPAGALRRELCEELGVDAEIGPEVARYEYEYSGRGPILLIFFQVTRWQGSIENRAFSEMQWCQRARLAELDFLEGDLALIQLIGEIHIDQVK